MFSLQMRVDLARAVLSELPNVTVEGYSGLTVDFARAHAGLGRRARPARAVGLRVRVSARQHVAPPGPQLRDRVPHPAGTVHLHLLHPGARDRGAGRRRARVRAPHRRSGAEEAAPRLGRAPPRARQEASARAGLEGAWVPIAACVGRAHWTWRTCACATCCWRRAPTASSIAATRWSTAAATT